MKEPWTKPKGSRIGGRRSGWVRRGEVGGGQMGTATLEQ